jgi:hypothetical protein
LKIPPVPPVGYVIAYEYLWASLASDREDGKKTYPCAVVMAIDNEDLGYTLTYVLGISHSPPQDGQRAIEIPKRLTIHLGLDDLPQWIYVDELNVFTWPGPDLRPGHHISSRPSAVDSCVIGRLPDDWFEMLKREIAESRRLRQLKAAKRTV